MDYKQRAKVKKLDTPERVVNEISKGLYPEVNAQPGFRRSSLGAENMDTSKTRGTVGYHDDLVAEVIHGPSNRANMTSSPSRVESSETRPGESCERIHIVPSHRKGQEEEEAAKENELKPKRAGGSPNQATRDRWVMQGEGKPVSFLSPSD